MKKLFSILLTLAMLLNVGIVVMAADTGLFTWGDFETALSVTNSTASGYTDQISKLGSDISTSKNNITKSRARILGQVEDPTNAENTVLKLSGMAYYAVAFKGNDLETGSLYKFSADVMLENNIVVSSTTYNDIAVWTTSNSGVYGVSAWEEDGSAKTLKNTYGEDITTSKAVGKTTVNATEFTPVEAYFYVPSSSSATKDVSFGFTFNSKVQAGKNFYVDNMSLVKVGSVGAIEGVEKITKPGTGKADVTTDLTYTGADKLATKGDIALAADYTGVSVVDGVLTVTSDAQAGTITVQIVKSDLVIATKDIVIEENLAESPNNLIVGGTFEDDSYKAALSPQAWKHASFDESPTTEAKHNGQYSLKIYQPMSYYPATFKAPLERGGIYKFTAYVKALEGNDINKANLVVRSGEFSTRQDKYRVYELQDGTLDGILNNAGDLWGTSNKTTFNTSDFIKFERYFYVTDYIDVDAFTGYIGIRHNGAEDKATFNYYIDDVSLIKVGEAKLSVDANYVDVGETLNYNFASAVTADNAVVALKEEKPGVTYENGVITVTNEATPGVITLQVKEGSTVLAKKDIVLFDGSGQTYVKTADSATGAVTYNAYVKESVKASGTLLSAKYGTAFESVASYSSVDMGDFWKIEQSFTLGNGTYKFMLWDGIGTMKPITDAYEVVVNIPAE